MSTGFECEFVEPEPGRWFYFLQRGDCPVGAWDWREFADAYGPFKSFEEGNKHLRDNHANPGGYGLSAHPYTPDDVAAKLIKEAEKPRPPGQRFNTRRFGKLVVGSW